MFHFRFWNISKRFGFVSILSFDIGTFVLSFLSVSESGSGSTLPDPDPLVRGMDPDPNPKYETVAEEWECFQGPISINVGRVRVVEFMKMPVEAKRVLIKAVRVPLVIVGEPKEAARVYNTLTASTTLSQPWESTCEFPITSQLSACRLQRPWECFRGCESVSRGRESVSRGRESVDRGLEMS